MRVRGEVPPAYSAIGSPQVIVEHILKENG